MRKLIQKLHSQHGASILLALLFLLACMMVAASVLMAAVSNAGKIRSNYEEQQRYLALSSALRLVAGEIEKAEYTGKYTVTTWDEPVEWNEDGIPIARAHYYRLDQAEGSFTCGELGRQPEPDPVMKTGCMVPLLKELDGLFAQKEARGELSSASLRPYSGPKTHELTLRVDATSLGGAGITAEDYTRLKNLFESVLGHVQLTVRMDESRRIRLTCTLTEGSAVYRMEAELTPVGAPVVSYGAAGFPGSKPSPDASGETTSAPLDAVEPGKTCSVSWKLAWIAKEAADA